MDTSTLRWILIIAGIALLAGLFIFGNPNKSKRRASRPSKRSKKNKRKARVEAQRQEPTIEQDKPSRFDDTFPGPGIDSPVEPTLEPMSEPSGGEAEQGELQMEPEQPTQAPPEPMGPPPEKVMVLYLVARDNRYIAGADLLETALKSGMEFGSMEIFHRMQDGKPVFSLANLTKPGYFDKSAWNTMETKGVSLFMALPGPINALDAWDSMVATARRIAEVLHLDLLDENKEHLTRQHEGEIKEELRDYERSQLPEG